MSYRNDADFVTNYYGSGVYLKVPKEDDSKIEEWMANKTEG
jgi:hypothetical protein